MIAALPAPDLRPYQIQGLAQIRAAISSGDRAICVQAVTGAGKTRMMVELLQEWTRAREPVSVYTNRRVLLDQLSGVFSDCGVSHGKRAAGHRKSSRNSVQLCMVQTERSRSLDEGQLHPSRYVLVDEAHLNSHGATESILRWHLNRQATLVGWTATPDDLGHLYRQLICCCNTSEAFAAGAILRAKCYGVEEPDRQFVKRVVTGEEIGRSARQRYCQMIVGRVLENWLRLNPDRLPTLLFAPGVPEAKWFAQELEQQGVRAGYIESKGGYFDGRHYVGDSRQELFKKLRRGDIEILCNRFVAREGLDIPEIYCGILACRIGSETSFLQMCGRILRNHPSLPGHVLLIDHGGNFHDYGSPNADRDWQLGDSTESRDYERREKYRDEVLIEPLCCPHCFAMRRTGNICPECGFVSTGKIRRVLQWYGQLREFSGKKFRHPPMAPTTLDLQRVWEDCFWGAFKKGDSYRQALCRFGYRVMERGYKYMRPNPQWRFMPMKIADHGMTIRDVPAKRIIGMEEWLAEKRAKEQANKRLFT